MARLRLIKTNFTNGEIDPLAAMRSDLPLFQNGAAKMRNVLPFPQGGFRRWDGMEFMEVIPPPGTLKPIGLTDITISVAGSGYAVGEILTVSGGTFDEVAQARVVAISGVAAAGPVTDLELLQTGDYSVAPSSPAPTTSNGPGTGATVTWAQETQSVIKTVDFEFSIDQNYLIVFTVSRFYIFRKEDTGPGPNQLVFTGTDNVYSNKQIDGIAWAQSLDVMLIFHKDLPIRQLTRVGESNWTFEEYEVINVPSFAFGKKQTAELTVPASAATQVGDTLIVTTDAPAFERFNVGDFIKAFGSGTGLSGDTSSYYKVIAFNTDQSVDVEVLVNPITTGSFTLNAELWLLEEASWTFVHGFPGCGVFFQLRLIVAGTRDQPDSMFGSRTGDIRDFNNSGTNDDFGILATLGGSTISTIQQMFAGRQLQLFTDNSEYYAPDSDVTPITPTNTTLSLTTSVGSIASIPPIEVDGTVYFAQRGGRSFRGFSFVDSVKAYEASTASLLSSHLIRGPRAAALKKSLSTQDGNYIWIVNGDDFSLAVFSVLKGELVNAWALRTTKGDFRHASVLDQTSYFHVQRLIGGEVVDYIEFFNEDLRFDAGVIAENLVAPVTVVSNLEFLDGESIGIIVDEKLFANQTVTGGEINLPIEAQNSYQLGLEFPQIEGEEDGVNVLVETLPSDVLLKEGTTMGKKKRVVTCAVRFVDTQGFYLQNRQVPFRNLPEVLDVPIPLQSGDKELKGLLGWNGFGQIKVTQKEPLAMTVLGLAYDLSTR
ncbi:MAG: hypothetical protein KAV87_13025 [Desulfobacteraceae bacterium]|nr:hypothetical protein [Desulfobacteraceae bacterium]